MNSLQILPKGKAIAALSAMCCGMAFSAQAYSDIFVDIAGIEGDSVSAQYARTIDAVSATGNFTPRGCGVIRIEKELDSATPQLIEAVVSKRFIPEIDIIHTTDSAGGLEQEFFRMTLNTVQITKLSSSTQEDDDGALKEIVSFRAKSIDISYTPLDARGSPEAPIVESIQCRNLK